MSKPRITKGQRVEVSLTRGMAGEWVAGTVLHAGASKVELDAEPPGMARIVAKGDIAEWRVLSPARARRRLRARQH